MIKSVQIKDGLLNELLGKRKIKFTDGINILWGKNGVGKTTLVNAMASYCSVAKMEVDGLLNYLLIQWQ